MQQHPIWPREYSRYVIFLVILIGGFFFYNRPLPSQGLTDPGEDYFTLDERTLPSSWGIVTEEYGVNSHNRSSERQALEYIDTTLNTFDYRTRSRSNEYMTSSETWVLEVIHRDILGILFQSGNQGEIIQDHIDNLARYMSGMELYPPTMDLVTALPSFSLQGLIRVGSRYTARLCHAGKKEQCEENFRTLFRFSQQMKNSNSLVGLLIGIVEEGIVVSEISYLHSLDPTAYQSLITLLKQEEYFPAKKAIRNAFASEYQLFKHTSTILPRELTTYTLSAILCCDINLDAFSLSYKLFSTLSFSTRWIYDIPETQAIARIIYKDIISNGLSEEFYKGDLELSEEISNYRTPGSPWLRKNIVWYHLLTALIPKLTWIHQRALGQEINFQNLITQ